MVNLSSIGGCGIIIKHHSLYTAPVMVNSSSISGCGVLIQHHSLYIARGLVNLLISLLIGPTFLSYLLIGRYKKGSAKPNQVAKFNNVEIMHNITLEITWDTNRARPVVSHSPTQPQLQKKSWSCEPPKQILPNCPDTVGRSSLWYIYFRFLNNVCVQTW